MAINYPGPFELRIGYLPTISAVQDIEHTQRLNIDLVGTPAQGDVFANYDINDKDGATTTDLATLVEDYLTIFNALIRNDVDIVSVELWKYPTPQSFDSVFWSTYNPTANVGTGASATQNSGQDIYTFRTQEGGIMKINIMEGQIAAQSPIAYAGLATAQSNLVDFILDGDGVNYSAPFLGRDTSYPFAFIKDYPGINEALWKKRHGRS
jgi:hypothetical protein